MAHPQEANAREIAACRPWLDAELEALKPAALVLLGATAAQALLGPGARVGGQAKAIATPFAPFVLATFHPAAVLRAPTEDARARARKRLVGDLATVAAYLANRAEPAR